MSISIIQELLLKAGIDLEHISGNVGEISDGCHTFEGLYFQRCVLFATICNTFKNLAWKSRKHNNGKECFDGEWFIVGIDTPKGSYTYHYENKFWDMFKCKELEVAKEWDGHTEKDVERLLYLTEDSGEKQEEKSWAEKEVELACKKENPNRKEGEWDYGCACYESALKAYNSLMEDGHSGYSIGLTQEILNRLIDYKPLTAIEDTDDIWRDVNQFSPFRGEKIVYQCKRMPSLYKTVHTDGNIEYEDDSRCYCIDVNNYHTYHNGFVNSIINEMYPVTMPYYPGNPIKVYCEDFLSNKKNEDFDTRGILFAIVNEERVDIDRYFKESTEGLSRWVEIDKDEYLKRKENKVI